MTRAASLAVLLLTASCGGAPAEDEATARAVVSEERDGLWLLEADGTRRRVTASDAGGFDYDALAAKQVEGRVILYWAAAPVLSPGADAVAYASNREAVEADTSGQSIWLVDLDSGRERALLHRPGRSFRPVGWLGDDVVVYIGDEPGVHGIDRTTGRTQLLAPGTFVAAATDGSALAVADGVPDDVRLHVLRRDGRATTLSPPPAGYAYLPQARFTDDGSRLLLEAAADSGRTRAALIYDLERRTLALDTTRGDPAGSSRDRMQ